MLITVFFWVNFYNMIETLQLYKEGKKEAPFLCGLAKPQSCTYSSSCRKRKRYEFDVGPPFG